MSHAAPAVELADGWTVAPTAPGAVQGPDELDAAALDWAAAVVPGTAAAALGDLDRDYDAEDWWFRCRFAVPDGFVGERLVLELDGIATVSETYLNGLLVLRSESMWREHAVDVGELTGADNELVIVSRALAPLLAKRRRPAARWRTRVVNNGNLRWYRTMVFGRSPGFAPGPAAVGPWRPVRLGPPSPRTEIAATTKLDGSTGVVRVTATTTAAAVADLPSATVVVGDTRAPMHRADDGRLQAELRIDDAARWWPHTHGEPALHELVISVDDETVATRRIGFRTLRYPADIPSDGLTLKVNDVPIFIRGAVWTPADLVSLAPTRDALRAILEQVRDAGMNMLRIAGTGAYETPAFHDLCDELGILVWQDLMFANVDYPVADAEFSAEVQREARQVLGGLAHRPSLAVVCGNNEVEQQPAMMGLDPALGRDELWDDVLPGVVAGSGADCAYVRSTPCGGDLPFHPDRGVVHYFGVSGYFRPPDDARRAAVRFASECLAFANVPDVVEVPVHHPDWKRGVQRDAGTGWDLGAGWDFDDVRDHYLATCYDVDPVQLRRSDHARYLDLSRAATGEVMAEVMGEWRRAASTCAGALVLWLKDMLPGAGLGVIDHAGRPKVALSYLRRALAPIAVWTSDEGVAGVAVHVANDRAEPLEGTLRVALYRDWEIPVAEGTIELSVPARTTIANSVERILGRFVDPAWAYRFGPPTADVIVVTLAAPASISQAFRFPAGLPAYREPATRMGIEGSAEPTADGGAQLTVRSRRLAYGVRVRASGMVCDDDAFSVEPGHERTVRIRPGNDTARFTGATLTALNLSTEQTVGVIA
jgi:beta-mannosidase